MISSVNVFLRIIITTFLIYGNFCIPNTAFAQQGMLGSKTITAANIILNEFTTLTASAPSGATSLTVASSTLNGNGRFAGNLAAGELVLIIQMQGATLNTAGLAASSGWGAVSSINNAGLYEFDEVAGIPNATTITLVTPLRNLYTSSGNVQVVRVPRYTTLTINAGASVTTDVWNGSTGGIIAIETSGLTTINGTIDASGKGFRGGKVDNCSDNASSVITLFASADSCDGAEKGEGIGGNQVTYDGLGGRYGRGAPANGGGGGNSHNAAGGGGANTGNIALWNGLGNPDTSTAAWITAWDLESANFHKNTSTGGGRGGYSYGMKSRNPLTTAPGNNQWGGNDRSNTGGYGGRPLDNNFGNRVYMGGGGGAGDSNNGTGTGGSNGGGVVYLVSAGDVNGTGTINANGADAATSNSPSNGDGTGGAGGGGSVIIFAQCASISNININAKGGKGGDQNDYGTSESEGPGGGGGGGYVSTTNANSLIIDVSGGKNGTSNSGAVTTFIPNGGTMGAIGTITLLPPTPYSDTTGGSSPAISVLPALPSYCVGGSVSLTASGGVNYLWSPSSGLSATSGAKVTANPTTTTVYTVTGSSSSGCTNTFNVTVTVNPIPVISVTPASPSICAGNFVNLSASGGNTYLWSPSTGLFATTGSSVTANPSSSTSYIVTGTDANGCTNTASTTVTVNPLPAIGVLPASPSYCAGQSASLTASGGKTYIWSPSSGLSATTGSSVTANPSNTATYTVTGTDGNGCTNTKSVTVTVHLLPVILINPATPVICNGQSVSLNASGANSYSWSPSSGLSATTGSAVTASPAITSSYVVTGTDANGCTNTTSVTVTVQSSLVITVTPPTPAICNGNSTSLTAGGANTFTWSPSIGLSSISGSTITANPTSTTTYKVIGTAGSCSDSNTVTVIVNPLPVVGVLPIAPAICNGQSVALAASGGNTYIWNPATGLSATTGTSVNANPSNTSTYIVTGTDANGCTNTANATVTINPLPSISVLPAPAICSGQSVLLAASGGNSYTWNPSSSLSDSTGNSVSANPPVTAAFTVTGTDVNGCSNTSSVTVTVNPLPAIGVLPALPAFCLGQSVDLTASGGNTYIWSPSSGLSSTSGTTVTATPTSTSSYIVTGTDANGCTNTSGVTVTVNPLPSISLVAEASAICMGQSVNLTASGGNTYSWSPSAGLSASTGVMVTANPTTTSSYIVTGTDGNGCSNSSNVTLTVNPLPVIDAGPDLSVCPDDSTQLTITGDPLGSTYLWTPSTFLSCSTCKNPEVTPLASNNYVIAVTDPNGCIGIDTVQVNLLTFSVNAGPDTSICLGSEVQLEASGGTSYQWSPTLGLSDSTVADPLAFVLSSTTYSVTGSSGSCSATAFVNITVFPAPVNPNIRQSKDTLFCITDPSYISYQWYFNSAIISGATGLYYVVTQSGNYNVAVTDSNGCTISVGINIVLTGVTQGENSYHSIYLYPDPSSDYVFVHASAFRTSQGTAVTLLNVLGQEILVQVCDKDWNGRIDLKNIPAGIYLVQVINGSGGWVGRFVKQ